MKVVEAREQFDPKLRNLISQKKISAAIIPVGAIEQHGPHLPISTDSDIVTAISKRIAKKGKFLLLPTISYGVSYEHAPLFQLSVRKSTLRAVLFDLCYSLLDNGIKNIFIINGHHGNMKVVESIAKKVSKDHINKQRKKREKTAKGNNDGKVFAFSYWHFMEQRFDHAGFVETSLMLEISKKNTNMKSAKKGLITEELPRREVKRLGRMASKSFPSVTKNGVWGDPTKASAKIGRRLLAEIVQNLQKKCQTCLTGKNPKLHQ